VYFNGLAGMGVHVILSGQAVRQLETEFNFKGENGWLNWLGLMRSRGCRFARIDTALDDIGPDGVLNMVAIESAAKACHIVSPFHTARKLNSEEFSLTHPDATTDKGETLYFGKRKDSNMFVRIYDKAAEQLLEGVHHIRVEMEAKGKGAEQFVTRLLEEGFPVVSRILLSYLDFKEPSDTDTNKSRWETSPWWSTFVGRVEKCRLGVSRPVARTLEETKAWIERQVSCSLAVVADAIRKECEVRGEKYPVVFKSYIRGLVEGGRCRYKPKHLELLGGYAPALGFGV
jgi:DNA relaxase NicK